MKKVRHLFLKCCALPAFLSMATSCHKDILKQPELKLTSVRGKNMSLASGVTPISYVDNSLSGSQKFVLRVGGQPWYMTNIQIRLDKLRYFTTYNWSWAQCEALVAQAASDGFNTVSIPVQWYEVETSKDVFDWTILDTYLGLVNKYNLKMEMLWFGANSTGLVGTLGDGVAGTPGAHLRTPDYVLYAPSVGSTATTSDYTIDRAYGNYTLDITDANYKARETYVLSQVMAHIASWDAANGSKHPVIGVQLDNEFRGGSHDSATNDVNFLSAVGSAVKNSSYVVWTRMNCIHDVTKVTAKINANESLRGGAGTNIDFIGIDDYSNVQTDMQSVMPTIGQNYKMIMENSGANTGLVRLAALAGNTAHDYYDMCGPDTGEGMYDQTTGGGFTPHSSSAAASVRLVNHMLDNDIVDIALNAQGNGLYVHNWAASSTSASTGGALSVTFTPSITTDIGLSIVRSSTELVLMSTNGGAFTYPASLNVNGATQGYFDSNNVWVNQGSVPFTSTAVTPAAGTTVRLTYSSSAVLPAPTGLSAVAGNAQVSLSWTSSSGATSYNVKRATGSGGPYTTIGTSTTNSYSDSGLSNGTTYYYVVSAVNAAGESANSSQVSATPTSLPNAGFETPVTTSYIYAPTGAFWTFSGIKGNGSGVTTNGSAFTSGNAVAPEGTQVAFVQQTGTITQTITGLTPGTTYTVSFMASQRKTVGTGTQVGQTFDVRIDGVTKGSFAPTQGVTTYTSYSITFTATATSHSLAFIGTNLNGGDNTVFIDKVQIN